MGLETCRGLAPVVALADGWVALLVGNSTYAHIGRLPNPGERRGRHSRCALQRLGFEVTTELDADRAELTRDCAGSRNGARGRMARWYCLTLGARY